MSSPQPRQSAPSVRIRCEEHKVSYSTGTSTGCPVCMAKKAREQPEPGMPVSPLRMAAIAVAAVGAYFAINRSFEVQADVTTPSRQTAVAGRLNPNTYQAEIQSLERVLYSTGPETSNGSAITAATTELSKAIQPTSSGNPVRNARLRQHGALILAFGANTGSKEDVGYASFDADYARDEWESVRSEVFTGANWFLSAGDVAAHEGSPQVRTSPSLGRQAIDDLTMELKNLMRFSQSAFRRVDQPSNPESGQRQRAWDETRAAISDRLSTMALALPNGRVGLREEEQYAHQYLEQAAREFHNLATLTRVPAPGERDYALKQAQHFLSEAKLSLNATGSGI
jgi:hypothetical protein